MLNSLEFRLAESLNRNFSQIRGIIDRAALIDRFDNNGSIAGRDVFDIHSYLSQGFSYREEIIIERRGQEVAGFFRELIAFVKEKVTMRAINHELNHLLPLKEFKSVKKNLKSETLMLLQIELDNLIRHDAVGH